MIVVDLELEQCVLGTILVFPREVCDLVEEISGDDFGDLRNKYIFNEMASIYEDGNIPSPQLVFSHLKIMAEKWNGLFQYIKNLPTKAVPVANINGIVLTLKDASARRRVQEICRSVSAMVQTQECSVEEAVTLALSSLDGLACRADVRKPIVLQDGARKLVQAIRRGERMKAIPTGFTTLDDWFGGYLRGETTVVAGRPSMGKSTLLFCQANQAAKKGANVLLFSLEMQEEAVVARMLSDLIWNQRSPIPYDRIIKGNLSEYELDRLEEVGVSTRLTIDDRPGLSTSEIVARARSINDQLIAKGEKLDVVLVDHLGMIRASDRYAGQKVHETGEKIQAMTVLAKQLNVAVIVAHQLSRQNENRDNKRPILSDLRDSGDIEQAVDNVLFPYRAAYYLERITADGDKEAQRLEALESKRNVLELIVAKCRNSKCGTMRFYCNMPSNVVRDKW